METWQVVLIAAGAVAAVAMLAVAVVLLVRLVRTYRLLRSGDVPPSAKLAFWGSLVYTVFPVDLLPDPVYLDDIGVLLLALHHLGKAVRHRESAPGDTGSPEIRR